MLLLAGVLAFGAKPAQAHPHVWITATSELIYAPDGSITGVRHAWTFDDMFSTYALQGIETKTKGVYSREELAPLAQTNVESLKEFAFFTFARADGKKEKFLEPVDYFLEYKDAALTLHFTLPLKTPVKTEAAGAGSVRSGLLHRLQIRRQGPDQAGRGARRLQDDVPAPERRDGRYRAKTQRGQFRQRRQLELRRDVRQQDLGGVSVRPESGRSVARSLMICAAAVAAVTMLDGAHAPGCWRRRRSARRSAPPEPQAGGIVGWLLAKQSEFYREMSATIRAAKSDGSAVWTLLAISFAYGIFHAAGPGHGKAVISSYLVANQETARRGIVLSFASALMQSLVAVLIVGICAWLLNATAKTMCGAERAIEIASYALIAAFGARLVWTKGGGFMRALQARAPVPAMAARASSWPRSWACPRTPPS